MKKQALIITAALLMLCMAGCSEKKTTNEGTTTGTTAAPAAAASTQNTSTATLPPLPAERLFGGYVEGDSADLLDSTDTGANVLAKIPSGTQLDIYESGKEGWYMVVFEEKQGYISASAVKEIPAYDMDDPDIKDIEGRWIYEEQIIGTSGYSDTPTGYFVVCVNGTYVYTTDGTSFDYGTVTVKYEDHPDGSRTPWFMFVKQSGEDFIGCLATSPEERTDGCLYVGNGGVARLVPDTGNAASGLLPDKYGFFAAKYLPESSVSVASLKGTWKNADNAAEALVITTNEDELYNGSFKFTDANGTATSGSVVIGYTLNPDNNKEFWFTFYTDDGTLWNAFSATGDIPLDDLYSGQDGALHLVRSSEENGGGFQDVVDPPVSGVSIAALAGTWKNADNEAETLVVTNAGDLYSGSFTFTGADGAAVRGNIKLQYTLNPDDSKEFWYAFYAEDGTFWNAFGVTGDLPLDDLYSGKDGALHFKR